MGREAARIAAAERSFEGASRTLDTLLETSSGFTMTDLLILRHGPTAWNTDGLIQGRTDIPLSPEGEAVVRTWVLPDHLRDRTWVASPLSRCVGTARLLGLDPTSIPALWKPTGAFGKVVR